MNDKHYFIPKGGHIRIKGEACVTMHNTIGLMQADSPVDFHISPREHNSELVVRIHNGDARYVQVFSAWLFVEYARAYKAGDFDVAKRMYDNALIAYVDMDKDSTLTLRSGDKLAYFVTTDSEIRCLVDEIDQYRLPELEDSAA